MFTRCLHCFHLVKDFFFHPSLPEVPLCFVCYEKIKAKLEQEGQDS